MNLKSIAGAFKYFCGRKNVVLMIIGAAGLSVWQWVQATSGLFPAMPPVFSVPAKLVSGLAGFSVLLVMPGIYMRVISAASRGVDEPVDWRALADVQKNIMEPCFRAALVVLWSFLPLEMYLAVVMQKQGTASPWAVLILMSFSLFYFPMALMMAAATGKVMPSLLPSNVLEPIFRSFKEYLVLLLLFWPTMILPMAGLMLWPAAVIGPLAASFVLLLFWACGMHLLGTFNGRERDKSGENEDR